jgi:ergothioneine biosynthesis protein EgtB
VDIGHDGIGFAFDNESPRHRVFLPPFAIASRPVTCGEWVQFIEDGGYERANLWLSEGWATVQDKSWDAPMYWSHTEPGWSVFTLGGPKELDPAEPVCHVSYYEADAFARWAGARLPTEFEWELAAVGQPEKGNPFDRMEIHPVPLGAQSSMFADVWQWTSSSYSPYPRFRPAEGAIGEYNGKFMVNQHVLRGGSCATPAGHARTCYRNFFPSASRWAFSGLRLAKDV